MDVGTSFVTQSKQSEVDDYIKFAECLKLQSHKLKGVSGISKLERKINAEIKFLKSLKARDEMTQRSHLKSSNLSHFYSLVHAAERLPGVVQVLQSFAVPTRPDCLVLDLVAARGHMWVKVIARKAQALHLVWAGQGQFGEKDLVSQAGEYLECAAQHPFEYSTPQVHFAFYNQVTQPMADCLNKMGITVWGEIVEVQDNIQAKLESLVVDDDDNVDDDDDDQHDDNEEGDLVQYWINDGVHDDESSFGPTSFSSVETHNRKSSSEMSTLSAGGNACEPVDLLTSGCTSGFCERKSAEASSLQTLDSTNGIPLGLCNPLGALPDLYKQLVVSPPVYGEKMGSSVITFSPPVKSVTRVNLDITTLIALVSSVTNGRCHLVFRDKILSLQAQEERENPVLPVLENYLKGKEVLACATAVSSFQSILDILGGQAEKQRAADLLQQVHVVEDQPSQRALALHCQGRVKDRSKVIFGTGDSLQAVTVSSNMGFVRAANSQGVTFSVFLHPARALTEEKEREAVPVETDH